MPILCDITREEGLLLSGRDAEKQIHPIRGYSLDTHSLPAVVIGCEF